MGLNLAFWATREFRVQIALTMLKVLIPTDFSDNAKRAARYAISIFGKDAHYTLMNNYEVPHSGATMLISIADILQKDALSLLRDEKSALEAQFPGIDGLVAIHAEMGPTDMIVDKRTKAGLHDLVVMGTKGATGLKAALVGSVTANTMQRTKCPLIAVPDGTPYKSPENVVLAADDRTLNNADLPQILADLCRLWGANLTILNVVSAKEMVTVGNAPEVESMPINLFQGISHNYAFAEATDPLQGINDHIETHPTDLICMINRKNDLLSRLLNRSTTGRMMLQTQVPLLAIHARN